MKRSSRWFLVAAAVPALVGLAAAPAVACAGLVGENGTIRLTRTSTLAAYHDGVERYVTSFAFSGQGKEVGSIVPLPGVPTKVERGGDWTLQRLEREVAPPIREDAVFAAKAAANSAEVLQQVKIDALDITILKGGGTAVGKWATDHGYLLTPDAPEVLDFYSKRSPIFMAARFNVARAQQLQQTAGDGTPIMLTIPTRDPWVPLRILSLGLDSAAPVNADVFLLTDNEPKLLAGGPGLALERHEWASTQLLDDLRRDKGMGWIPDRMWFTYMPLNTTAGQLKYDLAISDHSGGLPRLADAGVTASKARQIVPSQKIAWMPLALGLAAGAATFALASILGRRRPKIGAAA
jgi:Uncharacterized protein conserved in bacteria (DUF2330)